MLSLALLAQTRTSAGSTANGTEIPWPAISAIAAALVLFGCS